MGASSAVRAHQVNLTLWTLVRQGIRIQAPSVAFKARKVVVQQDSIEVSAINPEPTALTAPSQRRLIPFEFRHLDVAAEAIHGSGSSPAKGAMLAGGTTMIGPRLFRTQPVSAIKLSENTNR